VKRWAGLVALFLVAALGAVVISAPSELERRHATIRPGMTYREVSKMMGGTGVDFASPVGSGGGGWTRHWSCPKRLGRRHVELVVTFDDEGLVTETTVWEPAPQ
jgi:hypothetical protein